MKHIANWLVRWVFWLPIVSSDLDEAGETYAGFVAVAAAITLAPIGTTALMLAGDMVRGAEPMMGWWTFAALGAMWYLLIGLATFFLLPNRNYGPWYERGAW